MAEAELREAINQMRAAMESQQTELIALRQAVTARDQQIAEVQNAGPVSLAGEIRNLVSALSSRTGSSSDDVVDGKGVGRPPRLASRKDDFAEWTHKTDIPDGETGRQFGLTSQVGSAAKKDHCCRCTADGKADIVPSNIRGWSWLKRNSQYRSHRESNQYLPDQFHHWRCQQNNT